MAFSERFKILVNRLGASGNALAMELHRSNSQIHGVMAGKTRPRVDLLEDLARKYPQINMDWLINGRGDIWLPDQEEGMGVSEKPALSKPKKAAESQSQDQSASESYYREKYIAAQEKIARLYETIVDLQKKGAAGNAAG